MNEPDSSGPFSFVNRQPFVDADTGLALEDGRVFLGRGFGARVMTDGEVVFNTSMVGYQEIATDPSYRGQMVVLTHPQIGNYGVQDEARESKRPWLTALIVRDLAAHPNHWLSSSTMDRYLDGAGVPGIQGIDTRALTKHLRTHGTMRAALGPVEGGAGLASQIERLIAAARNAIPLSAKNLVAEVSNVESSRRPTDRQIESVTSGSRARVALVDCGVKHNIARSLVARGADLTVLPWNATFDDVLAAGVDGVVVSNGPGDPERMNQVEALVHDLLRRAIPTLGICLGHQVMGLSAGGATSRLKFGHHGGNHPVRDLTTGRVHITSQNHEFQVDSDSITEASGFFVSMVNLNDGSVEGLAHRELPAFSVQYHPEGCPGPQDNQYVFERFLSMAAQPTSGATALRGVLSAE
ncbi:MAG: carbamoyl-phosphate synthase, small subunit [Chloroflexi bacterium]|nr:carbamoyl-phosphate synthase, small subunit [Chloroflexota bacterium]